MNREEQFIVNYMTGRSTLEAALAGQAGDSERQEKLLFDARCFERALDSGYALPSDEKESEIDCRVKLAMLLVQFNYQDNSTISKSGLSTGLARAVKELEESLKIDAAAQGELLKDRRLAAEILLCLDSLWLAQSSYRYKRFGASGALGYLQDKPKLFEHLVGIDLPGLCAMLFQYWTEVGSPAIGEQWLRRAANGETFEDVASGTRFCIQSAHFKGMAQRMLSQRDA
jgi:hypothetical protein